MDWFVGGGVGGREECTCDSEGRQWTGPSGGGGGGEGEECTCDSEGRQWTGPSGGRGGEGGRSVRVIAREDSGLVSLQAASSRYGGNRASSDFLLALYKLYTPSRSLRSDSGTLSLQIPRTRLCTVGSRAFSVFGPSTWNDPPLPLRQKPSLDSFRSDLKAFLFLQNCRPAMFSVPFQVSRAFAARFKLCIFSLV